jgi:hypothetical protein
LTLLRTWFNLHPEQGKVVVKERHIEGRMDKDFYHSTTAPPLYTRDGEQFLINNSRKKKKRKGTTS